MSMILVPKYRKLITKAINLIFVSLVSKRLVSYAVHGYLFYRYSLHPVIIAVRNTHPCI